MCGFVCAFDRPGSGIPREAIAKAHERLVKRGPDDEGTWAEGGAVLAHRRLAIIDLDPRAAQPMQSSCGRYVIAFNGEIYNYRELRAELERSGVQFRTHSDTEVILTLFATDGEAMLSRLSGMFAFVIWDRVSRRAFVARDPYGIKPLYYTQTAAGFMAASQVKALLATRLVSHEPDFRGQAEFWMLGSVAEPRTWYRDINALGAGHCAWVSDGEICTPSCWLDIGDNWRAAADSRVSSGDVAEAVRDALRASIGRHLVADVPVAIFLSGGIDSGALAGLMRDGGARTLTGVTIAYDEFKGSHHDESSSAERTAKRYGVEHRVRRVSREEFTRDIPRIVDAMDQPSVDGVNTWYASKAVAELGLKVVVSGVGGDELFQGYSSFRELPTLVKAARFARSVPGGRAMLRAACGVQALRSRNGRWRHLPDWSSSIGGAWWLRRSLRGPEDLAGVMGAEQAHEALRNFDVERWVADMCGPLAADPRLAVGQIESMAYLRNQLLRDSDWASMDHGVELRTPLVDSELLRDLRNRLLAFASFPNKQLLSGAPSLSLPHRVVARRKTGFSVPVSRWLNANHGGAATSLHHDWASQLVARYTSTSP